VRPLAPLQTTVLYCQGQYYATRLAPALACLVLTAPCAQCTALCTVLCVILYCDVLMLSLQVCSGGLVRLAWVLRSHALGCSGTVYHITVQYQHNTEQYSTVPMYTTVQCLSTVQLDSGLSLSMLLRASASRVAHTMFLSLCSCLPVSGRVHCAAAGGEAERAGRGGAHGSVCALRGVQWPLLGRLLGRTRYTLSPSHPLTLSHSTLSPSHPLNLSPCITSHRTTRHHVSPCHVSRKARLPHVSPVRRPRVSA